MLTSSGKMVPRKTKCFQRDRDRARNQATG